MKRLTDPMPDRSADLDGTDRRFTRKERFDRALKKFVEGIRQLKPMCSQPYLAISLKVYCLHFCQIMW